MLEILVTDSCELINVKEISQEINQILKSLYEDKNTWDSWHSCTMCFSFSLSQSMFPIISPKLV